MKNIEDIYCNTLYFYIENRYRFSYTVLVGNFLSIGMQFLKMKNFYRIGVFLCSAIICMQKIFMIFVQDTKNITENICGF